MAHHYSGPDFSFPHGDPRVDHTDLFAFPAPGASARTVLIVDVHPSVGINPPGPTTKEPFAPEAVYELKVDTNGDGVADVAFRTRFADANGALSATVRRVEAPDAAGMGDGGEVVVRDAPVSTGADAQVTESGEYRFFAGWRSDPFFFDAEGVLNDFQFTGNDFFADKDVCSIAFELRTTRSEAREQSRSGIGFSCRAGTATATGCRPIEARSRRNPSSSPRARRRLRTSPASRRATRASSAASRTSSSTRAGIRPTTR